jgi:hypothetical protein
LYGCVRTLLLGQTPVQTEFVIETRVFPVENFAHGILRAFVQAEHRTQGEADGAAATYAAAQEPRIETAMIDWCFVDERTI